MAEQGSQQVPISEAMRLAIDHQQAGRLETAEAIYRAVLESEPNHAGASYNLALVALQSGRPKEAVPVLREAVQRDPANAGHWLNYAVALAGSGEPQAAHQILLQARERGIGGEALARMLRQVERMIQSAQPTAVVETVSDAGASKVRAPNLSPLLELYQQGLYSQVEAKARELSPDFPRSAPLAQLLGLALRRLGRNEEARVAFEQSLEIAPNDVDTLLNASANAVTLRDPAEARRYAERAAALQPDRVDALRVLADAAAAGGSYEEAASLYRRAIALDPNAADLYVNLGDSLTRLSRAEEAASVLERALVLRPNDAQARLNLGSALFVLGETGAAREQYRRASDLAPDRPDAHTAYLFCLLHDDTVTPEQCFQEHLRLGEMIEAPRRRYWRPHENDRDPERVLRVGFVSGDLREHAVAYLIEPIWQAMRGGRHQVIAYASMPNEDAMSARLRALTDSWQNVYRLDDVALAERILQDRIDVLFDLSGHTTYNRLPVFAMKPAPIQVSGIGYPGTTGVSAIDYMILHTSQDSSGDLEKYLREKLVRFGYRGFQPEWSAPTVQSLPALTNGYVTFGSFNRPSKIGAATIDLWSQVLHAVPDSKMLVAVASEARAQERIGARFEANGIAPERLMFRPKVPHAEFLAIYSEVDIALDTFPYSGATTTNHALWMGVPVLTLAGNTPQQDQSAAILGWMGMHDWVLRSPGAFVERAKMATSDLAALDRLRQGLRSKAAELFESSKSELPREMNVAIQTMWRRWCAGLAPESFTVTS